MTYLTRKSVRLAIATTISLAVIGLVFVDDFPIPMLAAVLVPMWISVSGRSDRPANTTRLVLLAVAGLVLFVGLLVFFVFAR